eukprot:13537384-Alexandrium_andersonii.AAC.1
MRQSHNECEGKPSCRMAKSIATNSASGVEWLEQPCRLLKPAKGKTCSGHEGANEHRWYCGACQRSQRNRHPRRCAEPPR